MALGLASRVHLFPVRHHSPRAAAVLRMLLDRVQPEVVLVEGPKDADAMIPVLTDPETKPPVALLAYRTDGTPASTLWPFATYSPEWVALAWAREHGKTARFVDAAASQSIAYDAARSEEGDEDDELEDDEETAPTASDGSARDAALRAMDVRETLRARSGRRSFEEFWEAAFEAPEYEEADFRAAILAFAELVRDDDRESRHRARDAVMLREIEDAAKTTPPEKIVCVLGAAHVAAIAARDVDPTTADRFEATVPTAVTVIPYSFPRLAEQLGYGAGNRAPLFYQRAHDAGCDFERAALEVLVDFTDHLRLRGFSASLADTIEAYRLATELARIRGKQGPGLDEVRDATIATLCRGEARHVDELLWPTVVGKAVGRVAKGVGKSSLQVEFWDTVDELRLPRADQPEDVSLRLADPVHVDISIFLRRLFALGVPYGTLGAAKKERDTALTFDALSRVRELWTCQWTPSTEIALVEAIVLGESLLAATERKLSSTLPGVKHAGDACAVLVDAVACAAPLAVSLALAATERLAATDDDLPSLARTTRALAGLVSFGSSRKGTGTDEKVLGPLLVSTFSRAALRLPTAAAASADEVPLVAQAVRVLHEIALTQPGVDREGWIAAMREVATSFAVHPTCAGTALGLLLLGGLVDDETLDATISLRLSATSEGAAAADFLSGFLEVNALALVKRKDVVALFDAFVVALPAETFRDTLPMLRRALSDLGKTERRYLVEHLIGLHARRPEDRDLAASVVASTEKEKLAQASAEIAAAMDDLDDLL